ncbi:hypothetical protein [Nocardia sp. NPDC046763]|uniref:hypothetical protein n=1 Tax=Nocardia sp. NPDC046763 TaxID=3155256 RepID=UPI00340184B9
MKLPTNPPITFAADPLLASGEPVLSDPPPEEPPLTDGPVNDEPPTEDPLVDDPPLDDPDCPLSLELESIG